MPWPTKTFSNFKTIQIALNFAGIPMSQVQIKLENQIWVSALLKMRDNLILKQEICDLKQHQPKDIKNLL